VGYGNTRSQSIPVSFDPVLWRRARISAVLELTSGREVVIEIVIIVNAGRYRKSYTNSRSLGARGGGRHGPKLLAARGKICLELVSPYFNADLLTKCSHVGPPAAVLKSRSRIALLHISFFLSLFFHTASFRGRRVRRISSGMASRCGTNH